MSTQSHNMILEKSETGLRVLAAARRAWDSAADFRARRQRYKRFTYGDQWSDKVCDREGRMVSEYDAAMMAGKRPMTNNLIRRLVKSIVGRFRESIADKRQPDGLMAEVSALNSLDELDSRMLEEFLISGCAVQRVAVERRPQGHSAWVDNINPSRFFVNSVSDPRGWDIELIGTLRDMSLGEVIMRFADGDPERAERLRRHYESDLSGGETLRLGAPRSGESFNEAPAGRCRVIEVWTLETRDRLCCHDPLEGAYYEVDRSEQGRVDALNDTRRREGMPVVTTRWRLTTCWHCRWFAPDGSILDEYDSPDGRHPFAVKLYPLTDGEVHSLVEDVIDQQLYINRLITLIDHIMNTSAKGALLFPVDQIPDSLSLSKIGEIWASPDGIIPYNAVPGEPEPRQLTTNATNIGARELVALEMQMFEEVSGVSGALMGRGSQNANAGVERYESEVRNALISVNDLLLTFGHFRQTRDELIRSALG